MKLLRPRQCALAHNDEGSVLTVWAMALGIFLGLIALSYDFGRLATTQSELQSFADSVALAAAGELDAQDDSISRATLAASTFIRDYQSFGESEPWLQGSSAYTLSFYPERPNDAGSVPATTDPTIAGFVRVDVPNTTVTPILGAAFAALTGQSVEASETGASAVAGFTNYACGITPMMVCVPSINFLAEEHVGDAVLLRAGGQGAGWGPGAFGWLDIAAGMVDVDGPCAGLTGNALNICLMSSTGNRTSCMAQNGVDIQGGQRVGNFEAAINVLFDIYSGSATKLKNDPLYAPAGNVRSSFTSNNGRSCIGSAPVIATDRMGLPPDDCHIAGSCDRFGDGNWSAGRAAYVATNYGLVDPFPEAQTRYDYYVAELEAMATISPPGNGNGNGGGGALSTLEGSLSLGLPQCSPHVVNEPSRRTMIVAGIDCGGLDITAGSTNLEVTEFIEIFLISPIGQDGDFNFWVEILGPAGGGSGGTQEESIFRDVVVLYD